MIKADVTIVGAGMMGLALALGLVKQNITVCIIDAKTLTENDGIGAYDLRISAITPKSAKLFETLDVWESIQAMRASSFNQMHVFNDDGAIYFDALALGMSSLGWIIENSIIQTALYQKLKANALATFIAPREIESISVSESGAEVFIKAQETIQSQLLVGADGANSWVRQYLEMPIKSWSYEQSAIVANVRCQKGHQKTAWQRFLPTGPLAFLPLNEDDLCSIVWSCDTDQAETLMAMNDDDFNQVITPHLEKMLGDIQITSQRMCFPLMMRHIHNYVAPSLAFIGDAAHTVHPLAGQGANLGFADVTKLLEVVTFMKNKGQTLGGYTMLRKYERERKAENTNMIMLMEGFHRLFSNEHSVLSLIRNQGLKMTDKLSLLKNKMIKYAMGV